MKKNKAITIGALGVGICIFATTALANYIMPSGYDALKEAGKKLLRSGGYENYTLLTEFGIECDGKNLMNVSVSEKYDKNGNPSYYSDEYASTIDRKRVEESSHYTVIRQDGYGYSVRGDGEDAHTSKYGINETSYSPATLDSFGFYDDEASEKVIRFAELLTDTIVGDIKNNFVFVGEEDGLSNYEISLDKVQIPEVINAGLSALTSIEGGSSYDRSSDVDPSDPGIMFEKGAWIDSAALAFSIDADGEIAKMDGSVTFAGTDRNGNSHDLRVKLKMDISDKGNTVIERIDEDSLPPIRD